MTQKKTAPNNPFKNTRKYSKRQHVKSLIVSLAVRGVIPMRLASWTIQKGGFLHD